MRTVTDYPSRTWGDRAGRVARRSAVRPGPRGSPDARTGVAGTGRRSRPSRRAPDAARDRAGLRARTGARTGAGTGAGTGTETPRGADRPAAGRRGGAGVPDRAGGDGRVPGVVPDHQGEPAR